MHKINFYTNKNYIKYCNKKYIKQLGDRMTEKEFIKQFNDALKITATKHKLNKLCMFLSLSLIITIIIFYLINS